MFGSGVAAWPKHGAEGPVRRLFRFPLQRPRVSQELEGPLEIAELGEVDNGIGDALERDQPGSAGTPSTTGYSNELSAKNSCEGRASISRTNEIASGRSSLLFSTPTPATFTIEPRSPGGK